MVISKGKTTNHKPQTPYPKTPTPKQYLWNRHFRNFCIPNQLLPSTECILVVNASETPLQPTNSGLSCLCFASWFIDLGITLHFCALGNVVKYLVRYVTPLSDARYPTWGVIVYYSWYHMPGNSQRSNLVIWLLFTRFCSGMWLVLPYDFKDIAEPTVKGNQFSQLCFIQQRRMMTWIYSSWLSHGTGSIYCEKKYLVIVRSWM